MLRQCWCWGQATRVGEPQKVLVLGLLQKRRTPTYTLCPYSMLFRCSTTLYNLAAVLSCCGCCPDIEHQLLGTWHECSDSVGVGGKPQGWESHRKCWCWGYYRSVEHRHIHSVPTPCSSDVAQPYTI